MFRFRDKLRDRVSDGARVSTFTFCHISSPHHRTPVFYP